MPKTGTTSGPKKPTLAEVPSLPFVGSLIPQHSGVPRFDPSAYYDFYPELRRRFGDFYALGFPGIGRGLDGRFYVLTDPAEMRKVVGQERGAGPYPRGVVESEWPLIRWLKDIGSPIVSGPNGGADRDGFMGRGETWKRLRTFLQTDLLSPQAAEGYVPGMVRAAELASRGAAVASSELNTFFNHCSFDLFCTVMFGEMTEVADPNTETNAENAKFCDSVCRGMEAMMVQMTSPFQLLLFNLGIKTGMYKDMVLALNFASGVNHKKIEAFKQRKSDGKLTENEQQSYLSRAIDRQAAGEKGVVSDGELAELCNISLVAAIDTTSSLLNWNTLHLALNPRVQEKLHEELRGSVAALGGRISAEVLKKAHSPYLHAVIRETHRLTPPFPISLMKEPLSDVEIHGTTVPAGSIIGLDSYSPGLDPDLVQDPAEFQPERWLPDAVAERAGTGADVVDHPYSRDPFSQGSRKCPGSRVAANETLVMLAQLVLDWKIAVPTGGPESLKDVKYGMSVTAQPKMPQLDFSPRISQ